MSSALSAPGAPPARTLVLVDGEHYPPVVRAAIEELDARGHEVVGAVMLGGTEKLALDEVPDYGSFELVTGGSQPEALIEGIERCRPDVVFDLSDSPVVDARTRLRLVAHTLAAGVRYEGADFSFVPPPRPRLASKPSVAVIGTAKRSGKTALAGHLARLAVDRGWSPVVVAMGRGGPPEPEVIDVSDHLGPHELLAMAEAGRHAASDHLEDALMARVPTIGTRRAGGGLAGAPASSTFARGVELANERREDLFVFEGSGAAIPPVHADATVCAVPAHADPELVTGYLGLYGLLLADLVVVTLASSSLDRATRALEDHIRELVPGTPIVVTDFEPYPLEPLSGRRVFFATTAPPSVVPELTARLEAGHGARVVGWSSNLANRKLLVEDLRAAPGPEVLVTELKAAAVDVATKAAIEADMDVVYCDNRPFTTGGDGELDDQLLAVVEAAVKEFGPTPEPHQ